MSQPAEGQTWADVKRGDKAAAAEVRRCAREALLIQYVAEMDRGLSIVGQELQRGDVWAAWETVAMMRLATVAVDGAAR